MSTRAATAAAVSAALMLLMLAVPLQAQCAMCRSLLATPEGERIAAALRSGIWVLLAAPFGVFAIIAGAAVRSRRRFDRETSSDR